MLLEALSRKGLQPLAAKAIAAFGESALGEIRARLEGATPELHLLLSQLLPAVGGRQSLELALEEMKGQSWDSINKVALSARAEAKTAGLAERKVMRTQVEKFLDKKKTADDELALRGAEGFVQRVVKRDIRARGERRRIDRRQTRRQLILGALQPRKALGRIVFDRRQIFLGTMMLGDETRPMDYGRDSMRDMAGAVERIGPNRWRLILPYPNFESVMDVIELVPQT